jgi:hypothetical protein
VRPTAAAALRPAPPAPPVPPPPPARPPLPINWSNRILSIDPRPAAAVASPAEAAEPDTAGDLFHSFWPKRRRLFSFFPTR